MAPLQRSTAPHAGQLQIQHFTHQHLLQKLFMAFEFNCNGCNSRGYGTRYRCSACDFDLHEQCATSPHHLSSQQHPHHQLSLVNRPGKSHFCNVCSGLTDGLSYTCQPCGFDAHPLCTQIPVVTGVPSLTSNPCLQPGGVAWGPPTAAFGGYHGANYNQPVMINHHQRQQQQQQGQSGKYSKVGKFAANVLITSLTGVPWNFSSKN